VVLAGLIASFLIGGLYFSPFAVLIKQIRNIKANYRLALLLIAGLYTGEISLLI
jgi:hypothetical protein